MAEKRTVDEFLDESLPDASKSVYLKAWNEFINYTGCGDEKPQKQIFSNIIHNLIFILNAFTSVKVDDEM